MEQKIFLTPEELQQLKDIQEVGSNLVAQFGEYEYRIQLLQLQKTSLVEELDKLKTKEVEVGKILETKYGEGSINIDTGEFIKV